jgi:LPS-assembly lipoprotein
MWSPDRRRFVAAVAAGAAAATGACGLRPLHGGAGGGGLQGDVALAPMGGRVGYAFREALRARIGDPTSDASYDLSVEVALDADDLAISERDDITRIDVLGTATYVLTARATGEPVGEGVVRSASGYNTLASPYATRIARFDAERRVIEDLATRVHFELATRFGARAA